MQNKPGQQRGFGSLPTHAGTRAWALACLGLVLAGSTWYLVAASRCADVGFPLDDSWIHQTYARNLARTGRFVYAGGRASGGSTSPLWTCLLALGYLLGVAPLPWAYGLGVLGWLGLAWSCGTLAGRLFPGRRRVALVVGLACLAEWHLAWAALSGMEITLFTALSLLLIERYVARARPIYVGLIGGLLVWSRPEGIVLVGLVLGAATIEGLGSGYILHGAGWRPLGFWRAPLAMGLGFLALQAPYVLLNLLLWGRALPTTFYAKHAEYQALLSQPLWHRLGDVVWPPLVGAQVLFVPGFLVQITASVRRAIRAFRRTAGQVDRAQDTQGGGRAAGDTIRSPSDVDVLLPLAWWAAYHLVYALRLPVGYHHGRYLMPTIPLFILCGIVGTARWVRRIKAGAGFSVLRVLRSAYMLSAGCLFVAFLFLGGRTYALDVCIIQGEMVDTAFWLRANTPPGALIAAHDVGAIGYFAERPLLDLAGLITPKVIPFVRDEAQLLDYLLAQNAEYVVTFPSWYPHMVDDDRLVLVYQSNGTLSHETLGDNMAVYRVTR